MYVSTEKFFVLTHLCLVLSKKSCHHKKFVSALTNASPPSNISFNFQKSLVWAQKWLVSNKNSIQSMKMFLLPSKMQKNASTHKKAHLNTKLRVDIHKCLSILKYVNIQKCLVYTPLSEEDIWINILTQKVQCILMDVIYGMIWDHFWNIWFSPFQENWGQRRSRG